VTDGTGTAIVGIGTTAFYKRGTAPKSGTAMSAEAILTACADAGIDPSDIDGFTGYSEEVPPSTLAPTLGIKELKFSSYVWGGGGGGSCAAIGNAAAAIAAGDAEIVVLYHALRRTEETRFGGSGGLTRHTGIWTTPFGLLTPAQQFALMVRRHMHQHGTTEKQLGTQVIAQRQHAVTNPEALYRTPLTYDDYFASRMISEPFRLFDCCLENDGAAAIVMTSVERAKDLRQETVVVEAVAQGGIGARGQALHDQSEPTASYATAGHRPLAKRLFERAGVGPSDIDVAQIYDHFSGMVLLQLEDYGFCEVGGSGEFVESGATRFGTGALPVNTHGGNLSEVNLHGTTHLIEGVRQIRGTAANQVAGAQRCLVTGGPSPLPSSGMLLRRAR
jgi:acetyl-CoA acetyltransferase